MRYEFEEAMLPSLHCLRCADPQIPSFGDRKIHAGDSNLGSDEFLTQVLSSGTG